MESYWHVVFSHVTCIFSERLPANVAPLKEIILLAQGCILLLYLKQHLKDTFGFTDRYVYNSSQE